MTEPQLEEAATMLCSCEKAMAYQEAANRKTAVENRVKELFGENAKEYAQPEDVLQNILKAADLVCDKYVKQIVITIKNRTDSKDQTDGKGQDQSNKGDVQHGRVYTVRRGRLYADTAHARNKNGDGKKNAARNGNSARQSVQRQ